MIRIAAVGDIHAPKFLDEFRLSFGAIDCSKLDLFFLAGDLILKGQFINIQDVLALMRQNDVRCPIIGCFGNEEYSDIRDEVRRMAQEEVKFLDDEATVIDVRNVKVGIIGSQGSLEVPTPWQAKNIPNIGKTYLERIDRISNLVATLQADLKILLTHYPPTYRILKGERRMFYQHIGCNRCESIFSKGKVDAVICAHSHKGIPFALVDDVPVYNVSLPASRKLSIIEVSKKETLDRYVP